MASAKAKAWEVWTLPEDKYDEAHFVEVFRDRENAVRRIKALQASQRRQGMRPYRYELRRRVSPTRRHFETRRLGRDAPRRRDAKKYPRVYLQKGAAWSGSTWKPGYYYVIGQTERGGMALQDEDRNSRSGEKAYALAKSPRGGALWFLAKNTRPVRSRM